MAEYHKEIIDGQTYFWVNGVPLEECCSRFDPRIKGFVWAPWLCPLRICRNCGEIHFLIPSIPRIKFYIWLSGNCGLTDATVVVREKLDLEFESLAEKKKLGIRRQNDQPPGLVILRAALNWLRVNWNS